MKRKTDYGMATSLSNIRQEHTWLNEKEVHYDDLLRVQGLTGKWKFKWIDGNGDITVFGPCNNQGTPKPTAQHRSFNQLRCRKA